MTWLSTATQRPLRPQTVSRRSDCTPELIAASTGHSASLIALVLLVGQLEDVRMPALLADARAGDARQPFGPVVPLHDAALRIDEDHGVVHVVQQLGLEERCFALARLAAGAGAAVKSQ